MLFFHRSHTILQSVLQSIKNAIPNPLKNKINHTRIEHVTANQFNKNQAIGEQNSCVKRAVPSASFVCGSLTVEASLALPICLGVLFLLTGLFHAATVYEGVDGCLTTAARHVAAYSEADDGTKWPEVYQAFFTEIKHYPIDGSYIVGGTSGIVLRIEESTDDDAIICLHAVYQLKIPGYFLTSHMLLAENSVYVRRWVGDQMSEGRNQDETKDERLVYVAENGVVYHGSADCTYLDLSIRQTSLSGIESMRNQYGEIYRPCEKCGKNGGSGLVYITNNGNRWHTDRSCSGLKRSLHTMTEDAAKEAGLRPCSRCGG